MHVCLGRLGQPHHSPALACLPPSIHPCNLRLTLDICVPLSAPFPTLSSTQAWSSLPGSVRSGGRPSREEALQAVAVLNRVRRLLSETSGAWGLLQCCYKFNCLL
jgi:hypothetical protein